ncbi:hypothetical protein JCM31598_25670 [Desulfonatronum parangueonense]
MCQPEDLSLSQVQVVFVMESQSNFVWVADYNDAVWFESDFGNGLEPKGC